MFQFPFGAGWLIVIKNKLDSVKFDKRGLEAIIFKKFKETLNCSIFHSVFHFPCYIFPKMNYIMLHFAFLNIS